MRYYVSLKAITVSSYNSFGHWGHFHISEELGANLGKVFSAIWGGWLSGLWHCDQSSMGTQLGVETNPTHSALGQNRYPKCSVINIG